MPTIGDSAPEVEGTDIVNGGTFKLSDHAGKVILLTFSWRMCGSCTLELPCFQYLWEQLSSHGVQVVVVQVDDEYSDDQILDWLRSQGVTVEVGSFPVINEGSQIFTDYIGDEPRFVPHTYVIGRDMVIRKDIIGQFDCSVLEGHIMDVVYMRNPVDVEMVMDVSDSMNAPSPSDPSGDSKLTMMKQAATMILDCLCDHGQVDDRIGLVWFTDDASEYENPAGQKLLPVQANWADLRGQINVHGTGICTAMGAGLQTAFQTLSSSEQKRFIILCTDGMQNIEPKVAKVSDHYEIIDSGGWLCGGHSSVPAHPGVNIASHNTCIHTISIGITANYESLLQDIAFETGGFYKGTHDPENDLDLIYLTDLCNCLAGDSPTIIHHNTGNFISENCEAIELFYLNHSVRKITVMLSWKESQGSDLTFWLYSPDGTLLDLHHEMKRFENHCLATIYLPRQQDGEELAYVGEWRMIIRGETHGPRADYHAFVIGEDREIKYQVEFPRKLYKVGDLLPIRISLTESEKPILILKEILMETARLPVPLTKLLAQYKVSSHELLQQTKQKAYKGRKDPIILKLEAMASNPRFRGHLKPLRHRRSLQKGDLECKIGEKEIHIPVVLKQAGLHSFKVVVKCETPENGPIYRTDMISVNVSPGKAHPKLTRVTFVELSTDKLKGVRITVTPRNDRGQLLGPGLGHELRVVVGKKEVEIAVEDQLDGTYQIESLQLEKLKKRMKKKRLPVSITFQGNAIWKGNL